MSYCHFTLKEREVIQAMRREGASKGGKAARVPDGRSAATTNTSCRTAGVADEQAGAFPGRTPLSSLPPQEVCWGGGRNGVDRKCRLCNAFTMTSLTSTAPMRCTINAMLCSKALSAERLPLTSEFCAVIQTQ